MKFNQGYNWFVGVAFAAGVICCFLPRQGSKPPTTQAPYTSPPETPTYIPPTDPNTYSQSESTPTTQKTLKFDEYPCTIDCSGHEAGYVWAERNSVTDEDDCDAAGDHYNSPSFAEGCRAYVNGELDREDESDDGTTTDPDN